MNKLYRSILKRLFDFAMTILTLPLWLPLFLVVALMVRLVLGAPIFFRQKRTGYRMKQFNILKFRSMTDDRDEAGQLLADELRLGRFGRFLRATSLDELPNLLQVLAGQLSLVGPRPLLCEYNDYYTERQKKRFLGRPGITGWAQVCGRNSISWEERYELDLEYLEKMSFVFDLKILLLTVWKVVSAHGVSSRDHVTMERFTGTGEQHKNSGSDQV